MKAFQLVMLIVLCGAGAWLVDNRAKSHEDARTNELHERLEKDVVIAKKVTSDTCTHERFQVVTEMGLTDKRFILNGEDMTLTQWSPDSYQEISHGDIIEFYINDIPGLESHHKLREYHNPDSKFCEDRLRE